MKRRSFLKLLASATVGAAIGAQIGFGNILRRPTVLAESPIEVEWSTEAGFSAGHHWCRAMIRTSDGRKAAAMDQVTNAAFDDLGPEFKEHVETQVCQELLRFVRKEGYVI